LAIADVVGGHWPETARRAALTLYGVAEEESDYGLLMLTDLRALYVERDADKLLTDDILAALAKMDERPWPEYARGDKPITPTGLSRLLSRFGVRPKQVRVGTESKKGYDLEDLGPAFGTYLPPLELAETSETIGDVSPVSAGPDGIGEGDRGDAWEPEEPTA